MAGASSLDKARGVVSAFPSIWSGRVVDVGCRGRELETALVGSDIHYVGVDIAAGGDIVADLGSFLPFPDGTADVVAALDVLEHTDDIHRAFAELCRAARSHVVVALPNEYELTLRLSILRGRALDKYGLTSEPPGDRHRWFFSLDEARRFTLDMAQLHDWVVVDERVLVGPRRARLGPVVRRWPNLWARTYLALLGPR